MDKGRIAPSSIAIHLPFLDEERGIAGVVADVRCPRRES